MKIILPYLFKSLYLMFFISFSINSQAQCLPGFGAAADFALFTVAGDVTNTAVSTVAGDIGTNAGNVIGLNSGSVNGVIDLPNARTLQASNDLVLAYNQFLAIPATNSIHTPAFGNGESVTSGVYAIGAAGSVAGTLYLDAQNNPDAIFIFKFGGALTTGAGSTIVLLNNAKAGNVYWIANGAIAMAASTTMSGTLIANGANGMGDLGVLNGRMYSIAGAITTYGNKISSDGIEIKRGGTLSADQTIYSGGTPSNFTVSGNEGNVLKWQKSSNFDFTSAIDITNTSTILTSSLIGILDDNTFFRAVVQKNSCPIMYSTIAKVTMMPRTSWNGSVWSNGAPSATTETIINGVYSTNTNEIFTTSRLTINPGSSFMVSTNSNLIVENEVINNAGAMGIVIEDRANLIQVNNSINTGAITVNSNSSALLRLDYTIWSSPVTDDFFYLEDFSPETLSNRFFSYNTNAGLFLSVPDPAIEFTKGKGYLIRVPNTYSSTERTVYPGVFTGVPNNGDISVNLDYGGTGLGYNMVGNPYPSAISMMRFINDNAENITGTLHFWRKTNNGNRNSYCVWTEGTFVTNNESQVIDPNSVIEKGQGFFVEAKKAGATLIFKNTQRELNTDKKFFKIKQQTVDRNTIWLNATDTDSKGYFSQMAVGYITNATQGVDRYDGMYYNNGDLSLNSYLANTDYVIQGRALPFDTSDVVPLSFSTTIAGEYSIALDHVDGLFSGSQDIFLIDTTTGTETNLKTAAYTFTAAAGSTTTRFALKYQKTLGIDTAIFNESSITLYKNKGTIHVKSNSESIDNVKIYDISGRLIFEKDKINTNETAIDGSKFSNQILVVQITSENNISIRKKFVN